MKIRRILSLVLGVVMWAGVGFGAVIVKTLDETQNGSVIQNLPANLINGVLVLTEDGDKSKVSEVVTFLTIATTANLFSDEDENQEKDFADITAAQLQQLINAFPANQQNFLKETDVVANGYTPGANDPGFFKDANGDNPKWVIKSDVSDIPEPSSMALFSLGTFCILGSAFWRRFRVYK